MSVSASGDGPFTYQWQKDDQAIAGATNATLTLASAQTAQAGYYSVVVSNGLGSVKSSSVWVSVIDYTPYTFTTMAGLANSGSEDGPGSDARFNYPVGVAVDAAGNVYVADTSNHTVRKMAPEGVVTTLAGAAGQAGSADGA